jgi:hypothetical protein
MIKTKRSLYCSLVKNWNGAAHSFVFSYPNESCSDGDEDAVHLLYPLFLFFKVYCLEMFHYLPYGNKDNKIILVHPSPLQLNIPIY